jgi:adenylyltransferase/sulfurtransferase
MNRYSRQILFPYIGKQGQEKLSNSSAVIIGCGALGTIIATTLVRAGVGKVRIIDRDFIEEHNLQRQVLFDEDDIKAQLPKAIAAERHLKKVNSSIEVEGIVADVNYKNIEKFVNGANVILDGLDNFETRFLINDVSLKHNIPWVYGGAISSHGMTMTIVPHETPCFRCIMADPTGRKLVETCDTAGVIGAAPFVIGSLQSVEAIKLLIGAKEAISRNLRSIDVWKGTFNSIEVGQRKDCPACNGRYEYLAGKFVERTTVLCGQNAVQVSNPKVGKLSFEELATHLKNVEDVSYNDFMLHFNVNSQEVIVFPDGRAIIKNTSDASLARALYAKYIGA